MLGQVYFYGNYEGTEKVGHKQMVAEYPNLGSIGIRNWCSWEIRSSVNDWHHFLTVTFYPKILCQIHQSY
jgi:hypothetical protein